jgi:hypothetical protein
MATLWTARYTRVLRTFLLVLVALFPVGGCIVQPWWGVKVMGSNGRIRTEDGLYDIPNSITYHRIQEVIFEQPEWRTTYLAAVPDCGFEFDMWRVPAWGESFTDADLEVDLPKRGFRDVEVSFVPSAVETNDCFATPMDLTEIGLSGSVDVVTTFAGMEDGEPDLGRPLCEQLGSDLSACDRAGASLWWTFRAPGTGTLRLTVDCPMAAACAIGVFAGTNLAELTAVVEAVSGWPTPVDVPVAEGDALRIMLDGWTYFSGWQPSGAIARGPTTSEGVLRWAFQPTAANLESVLP